MDDDSGRKPGGAYLFRLCSGMVAELCRGAGSQSGLGRLRDPRRSGRFFAIVIAASAYFFRNKRGAEREDV